MAIFWKLEEITFTTGGDGGGDLPVASFQNPTSNVSEDYSDSPPNEPFPVVVVLDKPDPQNTVVVPFTVSGTATIISDYHFAVAQDDNTSTNKRFVVFGPGETLRRIWVWIVQDDIVEVPDETVILTLAETGDDDSELSGATIDGTFPSHTLTILNDNDGSGSIDVFFDISQSSVTEGDTGTTTHNVRVSLSLPALGGETVDIKDVTVAGAGKADGPAGGATDWDSPDSTDPYTVTFSLGDTFKDIGYVIKGDTSGEGDETFDLELQNPGGLVVVPGGKDHQVTIIDDDAPHETAEVNFGGPGGDINNPILVDEGNLVSMPVIYSGTQDPHDAFDVDWTAVGIDNGNSGNAAEGSDWGPKSPNPLHFGPSDFAVALRIEALADASSTEGPEDLAVRLDKLVGNVPEITLGADNVRYITINDTTGGAGPGKDGDLTNADGEQFILERQPFDEGTPHLYMMRKGLNDGSGSAPGQNPFAVEAVHVPSDIKDATGATLIPAGNYAAPSAYINSGTTLAWEMAEIVWWAMHGPNGTKTTNGGDGTHAPYANTAAVPIGRELAPVVIADQVVNWQPARLYDTGENNQLNYAAQANQGGDSIAFWDKDGNIYWRNKDIPGFGPKNTSTSNTVIRDVVHYTLVHPTHGFVCATLPQIEMQIDGSPNYGMVDNIRFERVCFTNPGSDPSTNSFKIHSATGISGTGAKGQRSMGRIKLYDCQWVGRNMSSGYGTEPQYYIRGDAACWDMRHALRGSQDAMPWEPCSPGYEHFFYNMLCGSVTHPDLDYSWHPDAPAGVAMAENIFLNLWMAERLPRTHPAATFNAATGLFEGPPFSTANTFFQTANRTSYNKESDMSSGTLAFVRCEATGHGGAGRDASPGAAFSIWGHNGTIHIIDCAVTGHSIGGGPNNFPPGKTGGGMIVWQEYSGSASSNFGPQDRWRLERETDRTYASVKLVLAGFRGDANESKSFFKLYGVETVDVRSFYAESWPGVIFRMQSSDNDPQPGDGFTKEFRLDNLRDPTTADAYKDQAPYTAFFSTYPGFGSSASMWDSYLMNFWREGGDHQIVLNDSDVDYYATHYPAGYPFNGNSNGVVKQQYDNRLAAWGATPGHMEVDGGKGSPVWVSAFPTQPTLPDVRLAASSTYWIGEDETEDKILLRAEWDDPSGHAIRAHWSFTPTGILTMQTPDQTAYDRTGDGQGPDEPTYTSTAVSPTTIQPVGGVKGSGLRQDNTEDPGAGTDPFVGPEIPLFGEFGLWNQTIHAAYFRIVPNTGLSAGTKAVTFSLDDSPPTGNKPEIEVPPGSGTWVETRHVGQQSTVISVIPATDYPDVGWPIASAEWDVTNSSNGEKFTLFCLRRFTANPDGSRIDSSAQIDVSALGLSGTDFSLPKNAFWAGDPSGGGNAEGSDTVQITIEDITAFNDGDSITLTLDLGDSSSFHVQQGSIPNVNEHSALVINIVSGTPGPSGGNPGTGAGSPVPRSLK